MQREQVAAVVEQQVRLRLQHPPEQGRMPGRIGGLLCLDPDPGGAKIFDRVGLGAAEVARGDHFGPARAQGHQQRDRLGFEVDAGANGEPVKGTGLAEFVGDLAEQGAMIGDPLNPASASDAHGSASAPVPDPVSVAAPDRTRLGGILARTTGLESSLSQSNQKAG